MYGLNGDSVLAVDNHKWLAVDRYKPQGGFWRDVLPLDEVNGSSGSEDADFGPAYASEDISSDDDKTAEGCQKAKRLEK